LSWHFAFWWPITCLQGDEETKEGEEKEDKEKEEEDEEEESEEESEEEEEEEGEEGEKVMHAVVLFDKRLDDTCNSFFAFYSRRCTCRITKLLSESLEVKFKSYLD